MKRMLALSVLLCTAFATASAGSAFAQSSAPGTPSKPNKAATPPPPPPGGPDKLVTNTGPKLPGDRPRKPGVVDDFAGTPGKGKQAWEQTCRDAVHCEFLRSLCDAKRGGMSTNGDGSETCTVVEGPHVIGSYRGPVLPPSPPRPGIGTLTGKPNVHKYVIKWTCSSEQSCKYLDYGCGAVGGGMSTNGDGTQTCTVE